MQKLTKRQEEVLSYITKTIEDNGFSPSFKEIGDYFSFSPTAAYYMVNTLEKKGYLNSSNKKNRSLTLPVEDRLQRENIEYPFFEREPLMEELENNECGTILLPRHFSSSSVFAFRVTSSSMNNSGILPGDIAVIEKNKKVENNSIVLASKDEYSRPELRRVHISPSFIELWAENDTMGIIRSKKFPIYGILLEIKRSYR